jgi:hypothetical protein
MDTGALGIAVEILFCYIKIRFSRRDSSCVGTTERNEKTKKIATESPAAGNAQKF